MKPGAATALALLALMVGAESGYGASSAWGQGVGATDACSVTASAEPAVCLGGTIHLSAVGTPAGGSYSWTGPHGFTSILQNPTIHNARVRHAGKYFVTYDVSRCAARDSVVVGVDSLACSINWPDSLPPVCGTTGNPLCVAAYGAVSYAWSLLAADPGWAITGGQSTSCVTYTAGAGGGATFQVVLTSASGCRDSCTFADTCAASTNWKVLVTSTDSLVCPGGTIHLSAVGNPPGGSYTWIGPNGFVSNRPDTVLNLVTPQNAGSYQVSYNPGPECPSTPSYVTQWGGYGSNPGQFFDPIGVAVGPSGDVYVADRRNGRIQKFHSDGAFVTEWSTIDPPLKPSWLAVDADEFVYVADVLNHRIVKFTSTGGFVTAWSPGTAPSGYPLSPDGGIAVDASGVYVGVQADRSIHKYTSSGGLLAEWSLVGSSRVDLQACKLEYSIVSPK